MTTPRIAQIIETLEQCDLGFDTMLDWQDLTIRELRDYVRDHGNNEWYVDYYKHHANPFYAEVIKRAIQARQEVIHG